MLVHCLYFIIPQDGCCSAVLKYDEGYSSHVPQETMLVSVSFGIHILRFTQRVVVHCGYILCVCTIVSFHKGNPYNMQECVCACVCDRDICTCACVICVCILSRLACPCFQNPSIIITLSHFPIERHSFFQTVACSSGTITTNVMYTKACPTRLNILPSYIATFTVEILSYALFRKMLFDCVHLSSDLHSCST